MMGSRLLVAGVLGLGLAASTVSAAEITGEYLEARTCDVYTGPCFANGEIGLTGHEAVLAWKVDEGTWAGQNLTGLGVALIVKSDQTLAFGGSFYVEPERVESVVVFDNKATEAQQAALLDFVKEHAPKLTREIKRVERAPISLTNDHLSGKGLFVAGKLAKIETRGMKKGDCVCTNEAVFYPPLATVENSHPAYTLEMAFDGKGLDRNWQTINKRSAFQATFAY